MLLRRISDDTDGFATKRTVEMEKLSAANVVQVRDIFMIPDCMITFSLYANNHKIKQSLLCCIIVNSWLC